MNQLVYIIAKSFTKLKQKTRNDKNKSMFYIFSSFYTAWITFLLLFVNGNHLCFHLEQLMSEIN